MNNQYLQTKFQEKFKKLDLIVGINWKPLFDHYAPELKKKQFF